jgi:hypothetical protein
MKQMSTGFGLAVLGACVLGAAFIASPRFGQQAFAQVTGDRRIVSASVYATGTMNFSEHFAYRIWSDNTIEIRNLGAFDNPTGANGLSNFTNPTYGNFLGWRTVDNGLSTFVPADVDANGTVDTGDVSNVLLDFGATQAGNAPPPIDCTINAPR